jgi:alanyl-tRNA synthetase
VKSSEIRKKFIDFFINKKHTFVQPSPIVPLNDNSILFVNAGMTQFKDIFLGLGQRDYSRAVNSQICVRVSGKHNDLEEVGLDSTHLTSFEMLGNWSFGDYYKKEAIVWAWELFTKIYKIPKEKLYATVYKTDDESRQLWQELTDINSEHILDFGEKDNFWEMGATGPCGPCSEIHIDLGPQACDYAHQDEHICTVNGDCNRYVELWNLVFIQYNRKNDGSLETLPAMHVDTGAGLERLTSYLQNTHSVYETDLFEPIIKCLEKITKTKYQASLEGMALRVMADHIRTLTFGIADNVLPSNEGRGYVLRRLLRRALRYAKKLGINEPILYKCVDTVVDIMSIYLKDLGQRKEYIKTVIKAEEESFLRTLDGGLNIFKEITDQLHQQKQKVMKGKDAFKLYDTFGFPLDLTRLLAQEQGLTINEEEFLQELDKQKQRSRKGAKKTTDMIDKKPIGGEARFVHEKEDIKAMARHHSATHLLHSALRKVLGEHVMQAGSLVDTNRLRFDFTHFKALTSTEIDEVEEIINNVIAQKAKVERFEKPLAVAKQMGALSFFGEKYEDVVTVVKINDFSMELCGGQHVENVWEIEVVKIISEQAIAAGTRRISALAGKENIKSYYLEMLEKALARIKLTKLKQVYHKLEIDIKNEIDNSLSEAILKLLKVRSFKSLNLETHLNQNKVIDLAHKIEMAIAFIKQNLVKDQETQLQINDFLDYWQQRLESIESFVAQIEKVIKRMEKELLKQKQTAINANKDNYKDLIQHMQQNDLAYLSLCLDDYDVGMLRILSDQLIQLNNKLVLVLASKKGDKGFFLVRLAKDVDENIIQASKMIKKLTEIAGGGGGGKANMAQAGGANPAKIDMALAAAKSLMDNLPA